MSLKFEQFQGYRGRKVLVAGSDGFIGFNIARVLEALGAEVTLLSRGHPPAALASASRSVRLDLASTSGLDAVVRDQEIVFDCVGGSGAVDSNDDPARNYEVECRPHLNLFEACSRAEHKPVLVFLSSRLVYGRPAMLPVAETHPVSPASFYAVHKVMLEHYLEVYARTRDLRYVILRVTNPYGPGPIVPGKSYGVINQFIALALADQPLRIFGDGEQLRDYVYIEDLVFAMLSVAEREECRRQTYNVGAGQAVSIRRAIELIIEACLSQSEVAHVAWPDMALKVESGDFVADISKLRQSFPGQQSTSFADGIAETVAMARRALQSAG